MHISPKPSPINPYRNVGTWISCYSGSTWVHTYPCGGLQPSEWSTSTTTATSCVVLLSFNSHISLHQRSVNVVFGLHVDAKRNQVQTSDACTNSEQRIFYTMVHKLTCSTVNPTSSGLEIVTTVTTSCFVSSIKACPEPGETTPDQSPRGEKRFTFINRFFFQHMNGILYCQDLHN